MLSRGTPIGVFAAICCLLLTKVQEMRTRSRRSTGCVSLLSDCRRVPFSDCTCMSFRLGCASHERASNLMCNINAKLQAETIQLLEPTQGLQFRLSVSFKEGGYGLCNQLQPLFTGLAVAEALQADVILPQAYYRLDNYNTTFSSNSVSDCPLGNGQSVCLSHLSPACTAQLPQFPICFPVTFAQLPPTCTMKLSNWVAAKMEGYLHTNPD